MVGVGTIVQTHFAETSCNFPCFCLWIIHSIVIFLYVYTCTVYTLLTSDAKCIYMHKYNVTRTVQGSDVSNSIRAAITPFSALFVYCTWVYEQHRYWSKYYYCWFAVLVHAYQDHWEDDLPITSDSYVLTIPIGGFQFLRCGRNCVHSKRNSDQQQMYMYM